MNDLTQQAVVALRSGNKIRARNLLKAALRQDPHDVDAWLWLSGAVDSDNERVDCLQNVLRIDPSNKAAAKGYTALTGKEWAVPKPPDVVPPAFVPMAEGAPPAALEQLSGPVEDTVAPPEGVASAEAAVEEVHKMAEERTEAEAAVAEEAAAAVAAVEVPQAEVEAPAPPSAPVVEEPKIKSWEELLGPSDMEEPAAPEDIYGRAAVETSDTQEVSTGKAPSELKFVSGPSLGYGLLKLIILLVVFAALIFVAWQFLLAIPQMYVVAAGVVLAVVWVILLLISVLGSSSQRYSLAKDKLLIENGLFGKKTTSLPLSDVEDVQTRRSVMQKIGGVGDILLKSRTDGKVVKLSNLARFKQRVDELNEALL